MRLLQKSSTGAFSLTKDLADDDLPQYAILSHTWGADGEEVTFDDVMNNTGESKAGYKKFGSAGNRPPATVYSTSGSTLAASTNRPVQS
jgi:hypothetical protein